MLGVGQKFPEFEMQATMSNDINNAFETISNKTYKGKWLVVFFWPKDFTFVCPTEIEAFGEKDAEFKEKNTKLLGASVDSEFVHLAWRNSHPGLKNLPFPMLADVKRELSNDLGIIDDMEGVSQRATYIVDPEGIIRFASVTDLNVGRNVDEVVRVLDALQAGGLCPCNWHKGEEMITVG